MMMVQALAKTMLYLCCFLNDVVATIVRLIVLGELNDGDKERETVCVCVIDRFVRL